MDYRYHTYDEVHKQIRDGWLFAVRGRAWYSNLIAKAGRSRTTHVEKAAWWDGELFSIGSVEFQGVRAVSLKGLLKTNSGFLDVYECNPDNRWPDYDVSKAVAYLKSRTGSNYGWGYIWQAALVHLPFVRLFARVNDKDDYENWYPPFCSQLVSAADRAGGVDPVLHLADCATEPADLVRSNFYQYRFTLTD